MGRGAERQAGQRRRWRDGRDEEDGGLQVQFCMSTIQYRSTTATIDDLSWKKRSIGADRNRDVHDRQSCRTFDNH